MSLATLRSNYAVQFIFFSLTILFLLLALGNYLNSSAILHFAGFEGIICGASAIYLAVAEILNEQYARTVLPIGHKH